MVITPKATMRRVKQTSRRQVMMLKTIKHLEKRKALKTMRVLMTEKSLLLMKVNRSRMIRTLKRNLMTIMPLRMAKKTTQKNSPEQTTLLTANLKTTAMATQQN